MSTGQCVDRVLEGDTRGVRYMFFQNKLNSFKVLSCCNKINLIKHEIRIILPRFKLPSCYVWCNLGCTTSGLKSSYSELKAFINGFQHIKLYLLPNPNLTLTPSH